MAFSSLRTEVAATESPELTSETKFDFASLEVDENDVVYDREEFNAIAFDHDPFHQLIDEMFASDWQS